MTDEANEEGKVVLYDDSGTEVIFDVLMTFHSDEYQKDYILLIPEGIEEDQEMDVQAYIVDDSTDDGSTVGSLFEIENDKEWDMVEEVLDAFLADDSNFE